MLDRHTFFCLSAIFLLLCITAFIIGGVNGVLLTLLGTGLAYLFLPKISPFMIAKIKGARLLSPDECPEVHLMLRKILARTDLNSLPVLMIFPSGMTNAFTIGNRDQSILALSSTCLKSLSPDEIAAIMAHEVGHIVHGDSALHVFGEITRIATGFVALLGTLLLLFITLNGYGGAIPFWIPLYLGVSPWAVLGLLCRISRHREIMADAFSAKILGSPLPMMKILKRLYAEQQWARYWGLIKLSNGLSKWFGTHPSLEERLSALESESGYVPNNRPFNPCTVHIRYM